MSVAPRIAVTTDPWLFDGDSLVKPRRRFAGRKLYPDGLEAKGAGGEAARGYPASMRSWLSCRCIERRISHAPRPVEAQTHAEKKITAFSKFRARYEVLRKALVDTAHYKTPGDLRQTNVGLLQWPLLLRDEKILSAAGGPANL